MAIAVLHDKATVEAAAFLEEFIAKAKKIFREGRNGEVSRRFPLCLEEASFLNENDWAVLRTFDEILSDFHVVVQAFQGDGQPRSRLSIVREAFGSITDVLEAGVQTPQLNPRKGSVALS